MFVASYLFRLCTCLGRIQQWSLQPMCVTEFSKTTFLTQRTLWKLYRLIKQAHGKAESQFTTVETIEWSNLTLDPMKLIGTKQLWQYCMNF